MVTKFFGKFYGFLMISKIIYIFGTQEKLFWKKLEKEQ